VSGVLDAGRWTATTFGPDGGHGTPALCAPLTPVLGPFTMTIEVNFPANEVTLIYARFHGVSEHERTIERTLAALIEPIRSKATYANTTRVETTVRCPSLQP
jgi:hypothetical protein